MFPSIFTDELALDVAEALPIIQGWGLQYCDLRGRVFGRAFEALSPEQLGELKGLLARHSLRIGCLQSSLAKVHLPDADRQRAEQAKLEGIIRAADALDCRLVRAFFYWQPGADEAGQLAVRPDLLQRVLDAFAPLAERAQQAGLQFAFENCGVTPAEVLAVVDALRVPAWGLAWDVHNDWDSDERRADEAAYLVRYAQRARCVHVKAHGAVTGAGELIPYERVLATCAAAGLQGPVSAETHNADPATSHVGMSARVVQCIKAAWPTAAPGDIWSAARARSTAARPARPYADDPVRFVIVGLGMGHHRAKIVSETPGARLLGVCDVDAVRAKRSGEAYGVPYTTDLRPWLDDKRVEVVYVLTPTGRHAEIGLQALEAGKHVLTTKPMEASLEACDALIHSAESKGLLLGVDFEMRCRAENLSLKAAVANGRFGRLLGADSTLKVLRTMDYYRSNGGWRGTRRWDGGGVLSNQNIHHLDELAFCLGIPRRVRCTIWTQNHEIEAEDAGHALWEFESGLALSLYATTCYPHPTWYHRLELHGTEGALSKVSGGPYTAELTRWYLGGAWSDQAPECVEPPYQSSADNFCAAVRMGVPLVCDGRDGRRSQAILDAMYRSAYSGGGWVDVRPELE